MVTPQLIRTWLPLASIALVAITRSLFGSQFDFQRPRQRVENWVRSHVLSTALIAGLSLMTLRAALLPLLPMPIPRIYDEFSYLLMADTFASGRATNPSPPHWEHFETMFVQVTPTYQSVYPPAQGVFLAAGSLLAHHPWWGVLLEMGVFGAVLVWMLQAWLPPRWTLLAAALAFLQFGISSYWINSYWGGAPAAIGGALIVGAWPRLVRRATSRLWIAYVIGLLLLADSRPWEGFAMACAVSALLVYDLRHQIPPWTSLMPATAVLLCGAVATGWYFWRVTGSPLRMPYQIAFRQYAAEGVFFWQPIRHPAYIHPELEEFYTSMALSSKSSYESSRAIAATIFHKMYAISTFYIGPLVFCVLIFLPALFRNPRTRRILVVCTAVTAALFMGSHFQIHYAAPMSSAIVLVSAASLRRLRLLRRRGFAFASYLIPAALIFLAGIAALDAFSMRNLTSPTPRVKILRELAHSGAKHLVFVRYTPHHAFATEEWVYNDADLQSSPVVWARDMGPQKNLELIHDFPDRQTWLAQPDADPPKINEYRP